MNTYISEIDGIWYAYGRDPEDNVCGLQDQTVTLPWSLEAIRQLGSPSLTRDAAYRKANRWGRYIGREL